MPPTPPRPSTTARSRATRRGGAPDAPQNLPPTPIPRAATRGGGQDPSLPTDPRIPPRRAASPLAAATRSRPSPGNQPQPPPTLTPGPGMPGPYRVIIPLISTLLKKRRLPPCATAILPPFPRCAPAHRLRVRHGCDTPDHPNPRTHRHSHPDPRCRGLRLAEPPRQQLQQRRRLL